MQAVDDYLKEIELDQPENEIQEVYEGTYEKGKYHGLGKLTKGREEYVG